MSKPRFVFDKLAKLLEQGLINYKDFYDEIFNILKSKRDEIIFKMKLASQEETNVIKKRLEKLEKRIEILGNDRKGKKTRKARKF